MGMDAAVSIDAGRRADRAAGAMIGIAALGLLAALAAHPVVAASGIAEALPQIAAARLLDGVVHGAIIAVYAVQLVGFVLLARRLGLDRMVPVAGLVALTLASVAVVGATLLDGFVTPDLALHYLAAPPERQAAAGDLLVLVGVTIQDATRLALVAEGMATILWSVPLWQHGHRGSAVLGFGAGSLPAAVILVAAPRLMPHLLIGLLGLQCTWSLAVAGLLMRGRLNA